VIFKTRSLAHLVLDKIETVSVNVFLTELKQVIYTIWYKKQVRQRWFLAGLTNHMARQ